MCVFYFLLAERHSRQPKVKHTSSANKDSARILATALVYVIDIFDLGLVSLSLSLSSLMQSKRAVMLFSRRHCLLRRFAWHHHSRHLRRRLHRQGSQGPAMKDFDHAYLCF